MAPAPLVGSLGLLLGGVVTESYGWRVLFLGPFVPVGLALIVALYRKRQTVHVEDLTSLKL